MSFSEESKIFINKLISNYLENFRLSSIIFLVSKHNLWSLKFNVISTNLSYYIIFNYINNLK